MNAIVELYQKTYGVAPADIEKLPQAGSNRQYFRLHSAEGKTVIGVINPDLPENECFVYLAEHFTAKGLPMPHIYAFNEEHTAYLQEDLGDHSLYMALRHAREDDFNYTPSDLELLKKVVRVLPHIQIEGSRGLDFSHCISPVRFDRQAAMFDLNYFKYSFFKTTNLPFDEVELEIDLQQFAQDLAGDLEAEHYFLYRDFQARNVMMKNGEPYFIDFQGGMCGPMQYDMASFLWQASARYPQTLREALVDEYIDEVRQLLPDFDEAAFRKRLQAFVLFRIMQVLGAYGLRGYVERKRYFIDSIPPAMQNLREQLEKGAANPYPYLKELLTEMAGLPQFALNPAEAMEPSVSKHDGQGPLVVRVYSFSYKKGVPDDESGNGGGYVFDCRSTHNPGRYVPYKHLNGLDAPVIQFLEDDGEITRFLAPIYELADAHIKRYIERGFTNLMFAFGCTGGQHRSVYSAQHLAEHIHEKFGIEVRIYHREQHIRQILHAKL